MASKTDGWIFCLLLGAVSTVSGLEFYMDRTAGSFYCGQLRCLASTAQTDMNIMSVVGMTIYDITQDKSSRRLASMSVFVPDLYIDQTRTSSMNASGDISRSHANLSLYFLNETDCLSAMFMCELDFVNITGQPEIVQKTLIPDTKDIYIKFGMILSQMTKLTERVDKLEKNQTWFSNNMAVLDRELTDMRSNNTFSEAGLAVFMKELNLLRHASTALEEDLNELKHNNTFLKKELSALKRNYTDMEEEFTTMKKKYAAIEVEHTALKQNYTNMEEKQTDSLEWGSDLENRLNNFFRQFESLECALVSSPAKILSTTSNSLATEEILCARGSQNTCRRSKFMLWGNTRALCDTETDGGGWIIIQRRTEGTVNFYRGWNDYKNGFGTPDTDFWIGNDVIHKLTSQGYNEFRIDMEFDGGKYFAHYSQFSIGDEVARYELSVSGYRGTAGDSLQWHDGKMFSTRDQDHDTWAQVNCAAQHRGAWWYADCFSCNLNGEWDEDYPTGVIWWGINSSKSLYSSEMKIRKA